ncbi:hypothetical protein [Pollutibacter soli]|uniref:hypothetical protein n=1 Tax=Pollutibacter soli TaxID=3034157 RepID=UPI0030141CF4
MKRKMEKVTPKAGTLKQANQLMRTGKSLSGKLSAFVLMASMAFSTMSFVQDDDTLNKSAALTNVDKTEKTEDCCSTAKPAAKRNERNVYRLYNLPSAEMIRKSDNEAYTNLRHSLTESKLKALAMLISESDRAINNEFKKETTVDMSNTFSSNSADEMIGDQFKAENITVIGAEAGNNADVDMNDVFTAEVAGIKIDGSVASGADEDLNNDFQASVIWESYPSAEMISKADAEINFNHTQDLKYNSFAKAKTAKK